MTKNIIGKVVYCIHRRLRRPESCFGCLQETGVGYCEYGNELVDCIKSGEFLM
jgi:hypothetical protein